MKNKFINKANNEKLILFFNGWGMDELVVGHLDSEGFDICVFYHYDKDFNIDRNILKDYKEIYLIAWSMGVWAASKSFQGLNINLKKSVAINGTLNPVNDLQGIPVDIFKGTIDYFSDRNKQKFDRRMLGSKLDFQKYQQITSTRTIEDQLSELELIYSLAQNNELGFSFDKVLIGEQDLIFPSQNQRNYWTGRTEIKEIEGAHFPFFNYNTWAEIIQQ